MSTINSIYSYFSRNHKNRESQCLICGEKLKISQLDTTSLILHMSSAHPQNKSKQASQVDGNIYNLGNESNMGNSVDWGIGDSSYQNQSVINQGNKQNNIYNSSMNFGDTFNPNKTNYNFQDDHSKLIEENSIDYSKLNIQKPQTKTKPKLSSKQQKVVKEKPRVQKNMPLIQSLVKKIENPYTYPNYTGIINRPGKLLQKIKNQGYLEEPYIPHIPSSSKQSKQSFAFKQFFKDIDLALNRQYSISITKNKLNVSIEEAAQLVNDFWWGNKQMNEISSFFMQRGINFKESNSKNVILISQRTALSQYLRYGQCVHVVSYSQIVEKLPDKSIQNNGHMYDGYIFMCSDWRSEMIVLGMALVKINNHSNILQMLEIFFGYMNGFIPNNVILNCVQNQNSKDFTRAVNKFCSIYSCQIHTICNSLINTDKYYEKYQNIELANRMSKRLYQEIQNQVEELKKQIKTLLNEKQTEQNLDDEEFIQEIKLNIIKKCDINASLSAYDQDIKQIKTFIGLSASQEQNQSLRRKLYTVKKPGQQIDKDLSEFISRIFRLIRNFKKICKDPQLDYRYQYRDYDHPIMYRLYRKLGSKIFNILQKNYLQSSKLKIIVKGPLIAVAEDQSRADNKFKKKTTYSLSYSLSRDHWICNCGKLYQTGIPCSHLIAIVLKYDGCIGYYLNSRWMPIKGDRQKLKKLCQKMPK